MTTICLTQCWQNTVDSVRLWGSNSGRIIYPEEIFFIYTLIFTVSLICCLTISWLLWHLYQNLSVWTSCFLSLPTFPKGWFVEKPFFCPASYKEGATFMVQMLNCLHFSSKIKSLSLKMCFDFSTAWHTNDCF